MVEIRTNDTLSGHYWTLVGPGRVVQCVSVSEVKRMVDRAVEDQRGMYDDDPDAAIDAVAAYVGAEILAAIVPEDI